jgi:hypothetical protein
MRMIKRGLMMYMFRLPGFRFFNMVKAFKKIKWLGKESNSFGSDGHKKQ